MSVIKHNAIGKNPACDLVLKISNSLLRTPTKNLQIHLKKIRIKIVSHVKKGQVKQRLISSPNHGIAIVNTYK